MKNHIKLFLEEPFRIFFPLGALAGIWGVLMWPLFYVGHLKFYPLEPHASVMIQGFLGAFILGFLGTAFPRLSDSRRWSVGEFLVLLLLWALALASHSRGMTKAGDAAFCALLLALVATLVGRWIFEAKDTPPPGFPLVILGILSGAIAAGLLAWVPELSGKTWQTARLFLFQGFPLFVFCGVAPYLLPRFFGRESSHSFDASRRPPPGWPPKAWLALFFGAVIVGSFFVESFVSATLGQILRGLAILRWLQIGVPIFCSAKPPNTPANVLRWALPSLSVGLFAAAFWPAERIGSLHLFFVSGIGLATFVIACRVRLGHADRHDLLSGKIIWLRWFAGLMILAAITRMSADFLPNVRVSHHNYAAYTWAIATILWLVKLATPSQITKP